MKGLCRRLVVIVALGSPAVAGRVLVVCPAGWEPSLAEWVELRTAQGHEVRLAQADTPIRPEKKPFTLLLVGDGVQVGAPPATAPARVRAVSALA